MTTDDLIRHCTATPQASTLEADVALLISNGGTFLYRDDFTTRFIQHGISITDRAPVVAIDWDPVITARRADELPCSGGERRILQVRPASQAESPSTCGDTATGLDDRRHHPTAHRDSARIRKPAKNTGSRWSPSPQAAMIAATNTRASD